MNIFFLTLTDLSLAPCDQPPLIVVMPVLIAVLVPFVLPAVSSVGLLPLAVRDTLLVDVDGAIVRRAPVNGPRDVPLPPGLPRPVIAAAPVPTISPAVPPTVVIEEKVPPSARREAEGRLGDDNHLRRL